MLFAFREIIQKWIIARAQEALEIHRANREQINKLYSMCKCKNKKQNIQRRQGVDVRQLIPSSDIYLPVALFSNLLRRSLLLLILHTVLSISEKQDKGEEKYSSHVPKDLIETVGMCSGDA